MLYTAKEQTLNQPRKQSPYTHKKANQIIEKINSVAFKNVTSVSSFCFCILVNRGFPGGAVVKNLPANARDARENVQPLGQEDPLEEGMATHSSILAWKILQTEQPGRLQSRGWQRVRHN